MSESSALRASSGFFYEINAIAGYDVFI